MRLEYTRGGRCPACGGKLCVIPGSDRTVAGGTWFELFCDNCCYRMDGWKPRRTKRNK